MKILRYLILLFVLLLMNVHAVEAKTYRSFEAAFAAHPADVESIVIRYKRIDAIPEKIITLTNLRKLYLYANHLTDIPAFIGELKSLEVLIISKNKITSIPDEIGNLPNLKKLSIRYNDITEIPESLGDLYTLDELRLDNNKLTDVPFSLGLLVNLTFLDLSENYLTTIPTSLFELSNLQFFILNENKLVEIPENIGNLYGLYELDLYQAGANLRVPPSIKNCRNLEKIYVDRTIILPYEVLRINPRLRIVYSTSNMRGIR